MHPLLFTIGPVSTLGFVVFTASVLTIWFVISSIKTAKKEAKNDVLMFAVVLAGAAFILMLTKKTLPIRIYGLMTALGFVFGTWFTARQGEKVGIPAAKTLDAGVITLIFGIIGARLYHVLIVDPTYYLQNPAKIFAIWEGGQVLYGGVILGGLALLIFLRNRKIPILKFLDLASMALLIGLGFGRIGCFSAGCCYGKTSAFLAVRFPRESPAWLDELAAGLISNDADCSLPLLPTQLFSSAGAFLLFGLMLLYYRKVAKFDGNTLCVMLIVYSIGRFFMEMLRDLPRYGAFTAAQWTSIPVLVFAVVMLAILRAKKSAQTA